MRQDYLSTSYLDQKYLPSEQSERGRLDIINWLAVCFLRF